jgi:phosphonoacetaldehyde hydrolase
MLKIKAVILDWAGTMTDFGSIAPVTAFVVAFKTFGLTPTIEETRLPMGLEKRRHIETMLKGERLLAEWWQRYDRAPYEKDITLIYKAFEPALLKVLPYHAALLPGAAEVVCRLRKMDIKIGSTTGYTRNMMDILAPLAEKEGYKPDCIVCPDDVGGLGRPLPYMLWRNLEKLGVRSVKEVVKAGDTVADIEEGKNAGCLSIGVIKGSSILGFSEKEFDSRPDIEENMGRAREQFLRAGADAVIDSISVLPDYIETL